MNSPLVITDQWLLNEDHYPTNTTIVVREISIFGKFVCFRVAVPNEYACLCDIVPIARVICDKLLDAVLRLQSENQNPDISCRKGCAACCSYLVPLSLPEVFCLQNEFSLMPAVNRTRILKSCVHAAFRILKQQMTAGHEINGNSTLMQISQWYAGLGIQCPFLSDGECSIYEHRPLTCREHFVTSPPTWCQGRQPHDPHIVQLPISIAEVLGKVATELEQSETDAVMLPLALIGTDDLAEHSKHRWPAIDMVNLFFDLLEQAVAKNSELPAVS